MTDYLLNKKIKLNQPPKGFRTGLDTVLLAMTAPKLKSGKVLDIGAGVGALGLCYFSRLNNDKINITGIEKSLEFTKYYKDNILQNGFENNFSIINDDLLNVNLAKATFDLVITNPPFEKIGTYESTNNLKNIANIESTVNLGQWLKLAISALKPNGYIGLIHKMERLDEILHHLYSHIGGIRILPIITKVETTAKRVIIIGIKDSKSPLKMCSSLVLSDGTKQYTDFVNEILYGNQEINLYE